MEARDDATSGSNGDDGNESDDSIAMPASNVQDENQDSERVEVNDTSSSMFSNQHSFNSRIMLKILRDQQQPQPQERQRQDSERIEESKREEEEEETAKSLALHVESTDEPDDVVPVPALNTSTSTNMNTNSSSGDPRRVRLRPPDDVSIKDRSAMEALRASQTPGAIRVAGIDGAPPMLDEEESGVLAVGENNNARNLASAANLTDAEARALTQGALLEAARISMQVAPGAVSVEGMGCINRFPHSTTTPQHDADNTCTNNDPEMAANAELLDLANLNPENDQVLLEATLVDNLYVEATPVNSVAGGSEHTVGSQKHKNMEELELTDIVKSGKAVRQLVLVLALLLCLGLAIVVPLVLVGTTAGDGDNHDASVEQTATVPPTRRPPFRKTLHPYVLEEIKRDPYSTEALANEWMQDDPNLETYSEDRLLQRFTLAWFWYATNRENT